MLPHKLFLGSCYYNGYLVEENYTKAAEWFRKAAEQGYNVAQHNLGSVYYIGQGVEKNHTKAVEWLRKAAEQGNEDAIDALKSLDKYNKLLSIRITS